MAAGKTILCFIESLEAGGAQRQLIALASLLKAKGHHPIFVTYHPDDFYADSLDSLGIEHVFLKSAQGKLARINAFWKAIKSHSPYCVVSFSESASMILCILHLSHHFMLIVSERNATHKIRFQEWLRFQLYRTADHVVCNSTSKYNFVIDRVHHLSHKTHVIHNYLDTNLFKPIAHANSSTSRRLLVLARVAPQKNMLRFIEALRMVRDDGFPITVDWYGQPTEPYLSRCKRRMETLGVGDILHLHTPISHVEELYNQYDGFCLPSTYEGFPNVIGEAMSCGIPVLCGDVCDNKYILGEGTGNLVFDPLNIEDMKEKIEMFCHLGSKELETIGSNNRKRAVELFSSDKFVNAYLQLMDL